MEVKTNTQAKPRKVRISSKVREACDLMVHRGLSRAKAAENVGLKDNTLYIAMRKPEVLAVIQSLQRDFRTRESWRSVLKAVDLRNKAKSESVQADMTKWVAGLEGIAPVSRTEHRHLHAHQLIAPGLDIRFTQPGQLIEGEVVGHMIQDQTTEPEKNNNNKSLSPSVPHPALRNAQTEDQ